MLLYRTVNDDRYQLHISQLKTRSKNARRSAPQGETNQENARTKGGAEVLIRAAAPCVYFVPA
jgi:hypothetical protein